MNLFARIVLALCLSISLRAAEPNWPSVEQHALDLLQKYVRIASINPPANTTEAAALIKAELEAAGLTPKLYISGPDGQTNLIVRLPGRDRSKKPLLMLNHMDVVPVDAKAWGSVDPFGAQIKDGQLWGRGSLDMKGLAVEQLTALIEMKRAGIVPPRDIVMLSTCDEESSGVRGIQWMLKNHWDEIDPVYVLDEGGAGSRDLFAQGKLIFGVAVGEKQMFWLRLRAHGTAGHGSQPIADNANMILLDAIRKAMDMPGGDKQNPVVDLMSKATGGQFAENKFTRAIQGNTMSLTTLQSGVGSPVKPNVIPSLAEATLDCRLLPGVNADEFESGIKARINDRRVTVERLNAPVDAGISSAETPLFAAIRKAILKEHPDAVVTPILVPYGTDSVQLRKRGVPAYGFLPMTVDTATVATMHSDQERSSGPNSCAESTSTSTFSGPITNMEPVSHFFYSHRLKLQFWDWGSEGKPALILVHGGLDHARNWDWVARALRDDYHVYALDLRGHGNSAWAPGALYSVAEHVLDLSALADIINGFPVTIIGHSLGGVVSLLYAGVYPDRVKKVVAIEGIGMPVTHRAPKPASQRLREWIEVIRKAENRAPHNYPTLQAAIARMKEANPFLSDEVAAHLTLHGTNWNADGSITWKFDNYVRTFITYGFNIEDAKEVMSRITCPTLLYWGKESWAPDPQAGGQAEVIKNHRVVKVDNAGHWVHHDQLEVFLRETKKFLAE